MDVTKRNAAALARYAALVGQTPEQFLNGFLKHFLADAWADSRDNGNAEEYLSQVTLKTRAVADRLATWMQDRFDKSGFGPETKSKIEVIATPGGKFRVSC